ncbi:hypothetical protein [Methanoregula sp.]|uniref:hypothetical protein n=1 Tax=Methanoregula sp. TaxID=2052170 RepID=UPI003C408B96
MVSALQATDIPVTRTDALHVLALNGDDLKRLSFEQKSAIRKIYFLDDDRTVEQRLQDGDLVLTREDVSVFDDMGSGRRL